MKRTGSEHRSLPPIASILLGIVFTAAAWLMVSCNKPAEPPKPEPPKPVPPTPELPKPQPPPAPPAPKETAGAHYSRARRLLADDHFAEAIAEFTLAIEQQPGYALAYNGRGYARYRLKQYKEAIADFDEAIGLNPAYANAYLNRSAARRALGDKAGADSDLVKSKELIIK